jgi:mannan endo-1,4-beta-mannosidase
MRPYSGRPQRLPALVIVIGVVGLLASLLLPATAADAATPNLALGAYVGSDSAGALTSFERTLGAHVAIASSFRGWGDVFPDQAQRQQAATGHTLLVAWDLGATRATRFATFTDGSHDGYLAQEAAAARSFGKPLYIRPWAEMNGDWVPFQPTARGDRPAGGTYAQFVSAWRYLVTFFRRHGATNVRWVFNPTTDTYAQTTAVSRIWPGTAYVDVLGLDGYNWGNGGVLRWRSFADIYTVQYRRLIALAPRLPVWVCEFGSKANNENDGAPIDPRHSKASWYAGMLGFVRSATHIRALVLFNVRKERDWRLQSTPGVLTTIRATARAARTQIG